MDYLSSVYKNLFANTLNLTHKEKIRTKENVFFIDESLKINKLAFAFFLDRYKTENKIHTAEIASLSRYEWFAGSLTAEQFALSLHDFLQSPLSGSLSPEFRHSLQSFATALQKSENQGYLVDLLRSQDLKLILLILTGIPIGGQIDATAKEIANMSQHTVDDLKGLKPGEKRIYLVGDLFHETRLTAEKKEDGWEIGYFDSAQPQYKIFDTKDPKHLFDQLFWDKVYTLKFKKGSLAELEKPYRKSLRKKKITNA